MHAHKHWLEILPDNGIDGVAFIHDLPLFHCSFREMGLTKGWEEDVCIHTRQKLLEVVVFKIPLLSNFVYMTCFQNMVDIQCVDIHATMIVFHWVKFLSLYVEHDQKSYQWQFRLLNRMWNWNFNFKSLSRQKKITSCKAGNIFCWTLLIWEFSFVYCWVVRKPVSFFSLWCSCRRIWKIWLWDYFIFSSYHIVAHIQSQQFYKCWLDKLLWHNLWLPLKLNISSLHLSDNLLHFLKLQSRQYQWVSFTIYLRPKLSHAAWETFFSTPSWDRESEIFIMSWVFELAWKIPLPNWERVGGSCCSSRGAGRLSLASRFAEPCPIIPYMVWLEVSALC